MALLQYRVERSWHIIFCANRYKKVCYTHLCEYEAQWRHTKTASEGEEVSTFKTYACCAIS